jgi:hypothetical protein
MKSLRTLRDRCRQRPRNTRYEAGAAPYLGRTSTGWIVTEDALKEIQPDMRFDEPGLLRALDANRDRIYAAAAKVYARGRRGSYDLVDADF